MLERATAVLSGRGHPGLAGRTVLEIGGNIGTETVSFIRLHGARSVVIVEPAPANAALVRANVACNGLEQRVRVLPIALSDAEGIVPLALSSFNSGGHQVAVGGTSLEVVEVPARTLDGLIADEVVTLDDLALVWIDVQGHEGHVLAGARSLFDASVPIVIEYWPFGLRRASGFERTTSSSTRPGGRSSIWARPTRGEWMVPVWTSSRRRTWM